MTITYKREQEKNCDPDIIMLDEETIECPQKEALKRIAFFINGHPNAEFTVIEDGYIEICENNNLTHIWETICIKC